MRGCSATQLSAAAVALGAWPPCAVAFDHLVRHKERFSRHQAAALLAGFTQLCARLAPVAAQPAPSETLSCAPLVLKRMVRDAGWGPETNDPFDVVPLLPRYAHGAPTVRFLNRNLGCYLASFLRTLSRASIATVDLSISARAGTAPTSLESVPTPWFCFCDFFCFSCSFTFRAGVSAPVSHSSPHFLALFS